jgi:ATP-dependent helicase Lhr and Lhr-like helicase
MIEEWFKAQGWSPHVFQGETWRAQRAGSSGLVQVPTGSGKTYAAYGGCLETLRSSDPRGLRILYVTPLRAMTRDIEMALRQPVEALDLPVDVGSRTGDTPASVKAKQRRRLPEVLLTTPESLTLLLTYAEAPRLFRYLDTVIVDEWNELLASKRGTQMELALARLRQWHPHLKTWGLSATLANPQEALRHLAPHAADAVHITARIDRPIEIQSIIPDDIHSVPWAGNMGLRIADALIQRLDPASPTLVFTNTRNQAEMWHDELRRAKPEWIPLMGLHHGSLDRQQREELEHGIKAGTTRIVIATSSLDLGVDFSPIEQVVQIGSPKGIARLIQRAGRSNHRWGEVSRLLCMPASALHLLEFASAREAVRRGEIEAIRPPRAPLDVPCQHIVTRSLAEGFDETALYQEICTTRAYAELSRERYDWALQLVARGGKTLSSYPNYHKLTKDAGGHWSIRETKLAQRHRMMIGTITSETSVQVRFVNGGRLGNVEEAFAGRLRRGETFLFAGRMLRMHSFRDMTLRVQKAKRGRATVPRWMGGKMPLSTQLAHALRRSLQQVAAGKKPDDPEVIALTPIINTQQALSVLPASGEVLFETCQTREGCHGFLFTFEGRLVNDGLAALLAYRMGQIRPATFTMTSSDYGIEWLCPEAYPFAEILSENDGLLSEADLLRDTLESINVGELAKRQFRGIARIAGLTFDGFPRARKTGKQQQISAGLIYDVFARYDPDNLLLQQAQQEVLETQFEETRLRQTLSRLRESTLIFRETTRPTPLSLPLIADRLTSMLSTEALESRVARIQQQWAKV